MMLRRFLKIVIALPLATILVAASSGLTIFLHHCDCEGKTIFSLYNKVGCSMNKPSKVAIHSCCNLDPVQIIPENESCGCSNEEVSVKLDDITPTTLLNNTFVKTLLVATFFYNESNTDKIQFSEISNLYSESESPPPLLWGKAMLIRYNSLQTYHINS